MKGTTLLASSMALAVWLWHRLVALMDPGRWSNLQIILNVTLQRSQQPAIMLHHIMLEHHHASLGSFPMIPKFPISSSPWHAWRRSCLVMDHVQQLASRPPMSSSPWLHGDRAIMHGSATCEGNACKLSMSPPWTAINSSCCVLEESMVRWHALVGPVHWSMMWKSSLLVK